MEQKKRLHSIRIYFDLLLAYTRGRDRISLDRKLEGAKKKFTRVRPYTHIYTYIRVDLAGRRRPSGGRAVTVCRPPRRRLFTVPRERKRLSLYTQTDIHIHRYLFYTADIHKRSRARVFVEIRDRPTDRRCTGVWQRERESGQCASGSLYFRSRSSSAICSRAISSGAGGGEKTRFGLF